MNRSRLAVAILMLAYGALHAWALVHYSSMWLLLWVIPCFVGALGLFLSKSWSQYLVYLVGGCAVLGWAVYSVLYAWQGAQLQYVLRLLMLGTALIAVWGWSCYVVRRYFRTHAQKANLTTRSRQTR